MRIVAVGDIMPGGILNKTNEEYVSSDIKRILQSGDVRIGTLETAIGNQPLFNEEKMKRKADVIYVEDNDILRLKELDINIVSLANNHFTDLGETGARHAIELLDSMNILHCGAGNTLEEASKPAVIIKDGKSYAFIGFCDWREDTVGWCPFATDESYGVNPMFDDYVVEQIKKNKASYDYVIVIPHWGIEYVVAPSVHVYRLAKIMVDAGADLILGGHTHCIQPTWRYHGKNIIFSMGNFFFPDRLLTTPRSTYYGKDYIDISRLPVTYGYPRHVEDITLKRWRQMAQYGLIVRVDMQSGQPMETYVTRLAHGKFIELESKINPYSKKIKKVKIILNSGFYGAILYVKSKLKKFKLYS